MKEHFKTQLAEAKTITQDDIASLKGRSIYGPYEPGDKILIFMNESKELSPYSIYDSTITLKMVTCVERDLDRLEKDFKFVRMSKSIPVLEK